VRGVSGLGFLGPGRRGRFDRVDRCGGPDDPHPTVGVSGAGAGRLLGRLGLGSQSERRLVPAAQGRPARKVGRGPQKAAGRNRFFFFQLILQNTVLVILFKF
jgi:hypothetical protein